MSPRMRRANTTDSASEYSALAEQPSRLSYIQGSETDEEEAEDLTAKTVKSWSPEKVAKYFEGLGVDKGHCDVFKEQEFSGEVILGMEQSMMFLKELDLGPIGRRLKTWQKIKALQDAVAPPQPSQTRRISESSRTASRRASASSSGILSRSPYINEKSSTDQVDHLSPTQATQAQPGQQAKIEGTSPLASISGAARHSPRPSAASVRNLGHSRRHSSLDQSMTMTAATTLPQTNQASHSKQPSLDRNWNLGPLHTGQSTSATRPRSSTHGYSLSAEKPGYEKRNSSALSINTALENDRGYVSGSEADGPRNRRVLTKRTTTDHSRSSSYESKRMSTNFFRFGRGSRQSSPVRTASETHNNGLVKKPDVRNISAPLTQTSKADIDSKTSTSQEGESPSKTSDSQEPSSAGSPNSTRKGLRAISDAVTGREKAIQSSHGENASPVTNFITQSPGSSTPSAASRSTELEENGQSKNPQSANSLSSAGAKRKNKKHTSAYAHGLEKKPPQEQMVGSDYSGWMKKKSSNLVANWKPRLFVLRGRRLSYYYMETDREEKGLIDITGHRVLPADNERLTGIHATITKATTSPNTPQMQHASTFPSTANSSPAKSTAPISGPMDSTASSPAMPNGPLPGLNGTRDDGGFIFKLVPPRAGLSKAVNFTKPTVHYFAVPSVREGRLWMAALMKATIDRNEGIKVETTNQQKTISLARARARKERPPALQDVEDMEKDQASAGAKESSIGETTESSIQLEKVDEAADAEKQEEQQEQEQKKSSSSFGYQDPKDQMTEVTDLETPLSKSSFGSPREANHQKNKSSRSSNKRSGSASGTDGLGIQGLANGTEGEADQKKGGNIFTNTMHWAGLR